MQAKKHIKHIKRAAGQGQSWVLVTAFVALVVGFVQALPDGPLAEPVPVIKPTAQLPVNAPLPQPGPVNCAAQPCLALTFDDGPDSVVTPRVLDQLERHHAHATFFVLGNRATRNADLLRRMYLDGQEIGNHSWDHADLTKLTPVQVSEEASRTQQAVLAAGLPRPILFRPPYGAMSAMVREQVPMPLALWNVDPEDWHTKDPSEIVKRVLDHAALGRVVDLHDTHQPTADALDALLPALQQKYQLVTMSQLFNIAPGERGEFYGR